MPFNSSPPEQNGCHFTDNILKCIFMNEKLCIPIQISLMFVPKGTIDNKSTYGLVPYKWHAITLTNADPVHWWIYAALGGDELIKLESGGLLLRNKWEDIYTSEQEIPLSAVQKVEFGTVLSISCGKVYPKN